MAGISTQAALIHSGTVKCYRGELATGILASQLEHGEFLRASDIDRTREVAGCQDQDPATASST